MRYCIHDLDPATCADCTPRRPAPVGLVLCCRPDTTDPMLHRADCQHAQAHDDAGQPWPRTDVTEAVARASGWPRCLTCQP